MSLSPMRYFRKNILPYIIAYTAKWCMRVIFWTCKKEVHGLDAFVKTAKEHPCILMLWHNNLIIVPEIVHTFANQYIFTAFISNSRDGEPLAILTNSYRIGRVLRVPHNQRHAALHAMISRLRDHKEIIVVTPDGPRGPKYVVKPGIVMAAKATGAHVVPFEWIASKHWELGTWDAMKIPKPFSKIVVTFGEAIVLGDEVKEEEALEVLQKALA